MTTDMAQTPTAHTPTEGVLPIVPTAPPTAEVMAAPIILMALRPTARLPTARPMEDLLDMVTLATETRVTATAGRHIVHMDLPDPLTVMVLARTALRRTVTALVPTMVLPTTVSATAMNTVTDITGRNKWLLEPGVLFIRPRTRLCPKLNTIFFRTFRIF
ncbi:hypothetical protein RvY_13902-2 [Ramazzottius varieornatus]|uniref:Uncharacterized protein n=1 Tax=Ramazzottius varieornatus TaxID=947166 RepID=A0A1D1VRL4_RAMVA|nr:hypothetical protein RvY_13902-2 [Ramazzottius varieornatus]